MASISSTDYAGTPVFSLSTDDAKEFIRKTGAYVMEDGSAGNRVNDFIYLKKLPFRRLDGLDFCAQNSLYDKVSQPSTISTSI